MTTDRSVMGWADNGKRPVEQPVVGAFLNRPAVGKADCSVLAKADRPDLQSAGMQGFGFDLLVSKPFRTGKQVKVTVAVQKADGTWHVIGGGARTAKFAIVPAPPKYIKPKQRAAVSVETEVWYGGENAWAIPTEISVDAFRHTDQWQFVLKNSQAISMHNNNMAKLKADDLRAIKKVLVDNNIKLVAELAGLNSWFVSQGDKLGEMSAEQEMSWSKLWLTPESEGGVGGWYDYLLLDDPIWRGMTPEDKNLHADPVVIANELADSLLIWRSKFPNIKFVLSANFPNWGWKGQPAYYSSSSLFGEMGRGDFYPMLNTFVDVLTKRGVRPYAIFIDNPFDYLEKYASTNQRERIKKVDLIARMVDVERTVHAMGLKFGFYWNTNVQDIDAPMYTKEQRNKIYWEHLSNYIERLRNAGANIDIWSTYSWMQVPTEQIPETKPYTQAWNAKQLIMRLRNIK